VSSAKPNQGLELLSIPRHEEKHKKVWKTQVLLPTFLSSKQIFFVGPYCPELDYEAINSWFPTYEDKYPIVHKETIRSDFIKEKSGIFRASPPKDRMTFVS